MIRLLATHESVPIRSHQGHTATHLACRRRANSEVLEVLLAALEGRPEAIKATLLAEDREGNLPLHYICRILWIELECIRDLVNNYPEALHHRNHNDETAVELALQGRPPRGEHPVRSDMRLQMAAVASRSTLDRA